MAIAELDAHAAADLTDEEAGNLVTVYARAVVAGEIVAGKRVKKACARHLADIANGESRGLRWDPEAAGHGIRFFPIVLRHYKGEWGPIPGVRREGLPVTLEAWQCFIIGSILGWYRLQADGTWARRFRKGFVEVAKKNGKTLLFGGLGLLLAFFDGEPGAEVYSAATKKDQARLLWDDAAEMVRRAASLARRIAVPPRERPNAVPVMLAHDTASKFQPLSSETSGEEGVNPYAALVDELHRAKDRGLLDMLGESGGARRWFFLGMITTAGEIGPSIWGEEHEYAEKVLDGVVEDDGEFVYIAMLDDDDDWTDERVWPKANPNLGVSVKLEDLRRAVLEAQEKPGKKPAILRLRFNLRVNAAAKAIDIDEWDRNDRPVIRAQGAEAWGGLDLGWSRDLSGFDLWIPNGDRTFDLIPSLFCPRDSAGAKAARDRIPYLAWADAGHLILTEGNVRDDDAIVETILALVRRFLLRGIWYDRAMSTNIVNRLTAKGITVEPVSQTPLGIGGAWKELERCYLAHLIRGATHPVLRWMASNVEVIYDTNGNARPVKPHENSPEKIDGISAALDAIAGWLRDEQEEEFVSAYEGLTAAQVRDRMRT